MYWKKSTTGKKRGVSKPKWYSSANENTRMMSTELPKITRSVNDYMAAINTLNMHIQGAPGTLELSEVTMMLSYLHNWQIELNQWVKMTYPDYPIKYQELIQDDQPIKTAMSLSELPITRQTDGAIIGLLSPELQSKVLNHGLPVVMFVAGYYHELNTQFIQESEMPLSCLNKIIEDTQDEYYEYVATTELSQYETPIVVEIDEKYLGQDKTIPQYFKSTNATQMTMPMDNLHSDEAIEIAEDEIQGIGITNDQIAEVSVSKEKTDIIDESQLEIFETPIISMTESTVIIPLTDEERVENENDTENENDDIYDDMDEIGSDSEKMKEPDDDINDIQINNDLEQDDDSLEYQYEQEMICARVRAISHKTEEYDKNTQKREEQLSQELKKLFHSEISVESDGTDDTLTNDENAREDSDAEVQGDNDDSEFDLHSMYDDELEGIEFVPVEEQDMTEVESSDNKQIDETLAVDEGAIDMATDEIIITELIDELIPTNRLDVKVGNYIHSDWKEAKRHSVVISFTNGVEKTDMTDAVLKLFHEVDPKVTKKYNAWLKKLHDLRWNKTDPDEGLGNDHLSNKKSVLMAGGRLIMSVTLSEMRTLTSIIYSSDFYNSGTLETIGFLANDTAKFLDKARPGIILDPHIESMMPSELLLEAIVDINPEAYLCKSNLQLPIEIVYSNEKSTYDQFLRRGPHKSNTINKLQTDIDSDTYDRSLMMYDEYGLIKSSKAKAHDRYTHIVVLPQDSSDHVLGGLNFTWNIKRMGQRRQTAMINGKEVIAFYLTKASQQTFGDRFTIFVKSYVDIYFDTIKMNRKPLMIHIDAAMVRGKLQMCAIRNAMKILHENRIPFLFVIPNSILETWDLDFILLNAKDTCWAEAKTVQEGINALCVIYCLNPGIGFFENTFGLDKHDKTFTNLMGKHGSRFVKELYKIATKHGINVFMELINQQGTTAYEIICNYGPSEYHIIKNELCNGYGLRLLSDTDWNLRRSGLSTRQIRNSMPSGVIRMDTSIVYRYTYQLSTYIPNGFITTYSEAITKEIQDWPGYGCDDTTVFTSSHGHEGMIFEKNVSGKCESVMLPYESWNYELKGLLSPRVKKLLNAYVWKVDGLQRVKLSTTLIVDLLRLRVCNSDDRNAGQNDGTDNKTLLLMYVPGKISPMCHLFRENEKFTCDSFSYMFFSDHAYLNSFECKELKIDFGNLNCLNPSHLMGFVPKDIGFCGGKSVASASHKLRCLRRPIAIDRDYINNSLIKHQCFYDMWHIENGKILYPCECVETIYSFKRFHQHECVEFFYQ